MSGPEVVSLKHARRWLLTDRGLNCRSLPATGHEVAVEVAGELGHVLKSHQGNSSLGIMGEALGEGGRSQWRMV
jgi:hypothetical protein